MIRKVRHVGLEVKDIGRALNWYRRLGFTVLNRRREIWYGQDLDVIKLDPPLELVEPSEPAGWPNHIALEVDEFPEGLDITLKTTTQEGFVVAWAQDPDGNRIELVKPMEPVESNQEDEAETIHNSGDRDKPQR